MSESTIRARAEASELDAHDPLAHFRVRFRLPLGADGQPLLYLNGNSLGLAPLAARALIEQELADWEALAVHAHFRPDAPWYTYHELLRDPAARLVGAHPSEVVIMNSLTVNLHLLMVTFYRPSAERHKILIEEHAFPSDAYAVESQIRHHGYDPATGVVVARARAGESALRTEDVERILDERGGEIALVLLGGVNYFTGQVFDMQRLAAAARRNGCAFGLDLAHAAGNVPMQLHDWDVDFAAWCSYKYLNAGPGAPAGAFIHQRHARRTDLPRFAGWWGNDPAGRFRVQNHARFEPRPDADGWQLSNPPIFSMAPLRASLRIFDEAGMEALREKSVRLSAYAARLLAELGPSIEVITPSDPAARGCQLSLRVRSRAAETFRTLNARRVVADFREPDVIRVAPVPLYNTFDEVFRFVDLLGAVARG